MTDIKPWDGRPENPDRDGWHWLQNRKPSCNPYPVMWAAEKGWVWQAVAYFPTPDTAFRYRYLGPCLTPSEIAALRQERDAAVIRPVLDDAERDLIRWEERVKALEEAAEVCRTWAQDHLCVQPGQGPLVAAIRALAQQEPQA